MSHKPKLTTGVAETCALWICRNSDIRIKWNCRFEVDLSRFYSKSGEVKFPPSRRLKSTWQALKSKLGQITQVYIRCFLLLLQSVCRINIHLYSSVLFVNKFVMAGLRVRDDVDFLTKQLIRSLTGFPVISDNKLWSCGIKYYVGTVSFYTDIRVATNPQCTSFSHARG